MSRLRKPLPQFTSLEEAIEFFERYGELEFFGRAGKDHEYCVYLYRVKDGRVLKLNIYDSGKVEIVD